MTVFVHFQQPCAHNKQSRQPPRGCAAKRYLLLYGVATADKRSGRTREYGLPRTPVSTILQKTLLVDGREAGRGLREEQALPLPVCAPIYNESRMRTAEDVGPYRFVRILLCVHGRDVCRGLRAIREWPLQGWRFPANNAATAPFLLLKGFGWG